MYCETSCKNVLRIRSKYDSFLCTMKHQHFKSSAKRQMLAGCLIFGKLLFFPATIINLQYRNFNKLQKYRQPMLLGWMLIQSNIQGSPERCAHQDPSLSCGGQMEGCRQALCVQQALVTLLGSIIGSEVQAPRQPCTCHILITSPVEQEGPRAMHGAMPHLWHCHRPHASAPDELDGTNGSLPKEAQAVS